MFEKDERGIIIGCVVYDYGTLVDVKCTRCAIRETCTNKWKTEEQIKEEKEFLAKYQG